MVELRANVFIGFNPCRPGNGQWNTGTTKITCHQFGADKWGLAGPCPGAMVVLGHFGATQCVQATIHVVERLHGLLGGFLDAIGHRHIADGAVGTFCRCAIVRKYIKNQGIFAQSQPLEFIHYLSGLGVRMLQIACKYFHQARLKGFLIRRQTAPRG